MTFFLFRVDFNKMCAKIGLLSAFCISYTYFLFKLSVYF